MKPKQIKEVSKRYKIINTLIKTKTNFSKISKEIYNFEKHASFDKTSSKQLIQWLKEEIKNYENAKSKVIKQNKLMDILILTIQISRRENMNLDRAWIRWLWKSNKYLKEIK